VKRNAVVYVVVKSVDDDDGVFCAERRAGDFPCCFRGTANDAEGRALAIIPVRVISNVGRRDGEISVVVFFFFFFFFFFFQGGGGGDDDDDDDSNRGDPCRGDGWVADIFIEPERTKKRERKANVLATDTRKLSKRVRRH
tara:strand:+ start:516 stop:935 length:420 start_codon:yes stop_codon:yes gene_type:complete